ncbi:helix-turn-helix domain-containing protein [Nodosilinea nodulosa]|uniref:helix-turn-helix domain-containing protein n=1 Tax=Nodosilinea nodulosa TaxID=416001 RepID=UPI00030F4F4A|nr:helix-turn-helix domain-containing protein [Nodosilinea nodulosa]
MAKLAPTQIEQLQSIGAYLRQVRQEQGLSIDMLANQIFIRPALLQALESGQDSALPEPVFIQGFIRRYAEALGLDGQTISKEFRVTPVDILPTPELVEQVNTNGITNGSTNGIVEPAPRPSKQRVEPSYSTPVVGSEQRSPLPLLLGLGVLVAVLGLGAWGIFGRSSGTSQANNGDPTVGATPDQTDTAAIPGDGTAAGTSGAEIDGTGTDGTGTDGKNGADSLEPSDASDDGSKQPLEAPVVVSASLSDRAWLSVVADGKNVYEGIAESGFKETWTAKNSLVFRTGNAGGVELSVNGDRAVALGSSGVVRTLTFTPDSGAETAQTP